MLNTYLEISSEVASALENKQPIVSLESTIISHGMPYPQNLETALEVEDVIRNEGVTPATIAVLNGKLKVGLNAEELKTLAQTKEVMKLSRRDLPYAILKKIPGATTVAATMIISELAGIQFFATGGVGGVHRGFEKTLDISADLQELSKTSVCVVCSGIKSILDMKATLEYLETMGVPVIGYQSNELAAFYTRDSGIGLNLSMENAKEIADFLRIKWNLGLQGGALISNPIPKPNSLDPVQIESTIQEALNLAKKESITGKDLTPYLLDKIKYLTEGTSLRANIALIKHNALIAAKISKAWQGN